MRPDLPPGEVHVWRLPLVAAGPDLDRHWADLSDDERRRADRLRRAGDRVRFIAGRGALRDRLAAYHGLAAGRVSFEYGVHGKPFVVAAGAPSPLSFNLTHSAGLALLAVALDRAVGVDLESRRPMPHADAIVARYFTEPERLDYASLPEADRPLAFLRAWTRKEAYLKATGEGIARGLHLTSVSLRPADPPRVTSVAGRPDEAARWTLADLDVGDGFVAALAVEGSDWALRRLDGEGGIGPGATVARGDEDR